VMLPRPKFEKSVRALVSSAVAEVATGQNDGL
jgi:hypothetical protein